MPSFSFKGRRDFAISYTSNANARSVEIETPKKLHVLTN